MLIASASCLSGCSQSSGPSAETAGAVVPDAAFLLAERPADAQDVAQARETSQDGEDLAVLGRIGGSAQPFVDGLAAFTIVDPKLAWCGEDEGCPTPWDYCCADTTGKVATVKIVGADGEPVARDARTLLGVKELSQVVVRGKARRDDQGNLTVLAEKVYVVQD
jgi:hypothetical protein